MQMSENGSSGIGRGRARAPLKEISINKDIPVPSAEGLGEKCLTEFGGPTPGQKKTTSSSVSSGDSKGKPKLQDSDIGNKGNVVRKRLVCIGRGRESVASHSGFGETPSSVAKSELFQSGEKELSSSDKKPFIGRGIIFSNEEGSGSTPSDDQSMKEMKITEEVEPIADKSKFEDGDKKDGPRFIRRERPVAIKEADQKRNEKAPQVKLSANYVKVEKEDPHLYHYDVSLDPDIDSQPKRMKILLSLTELKIGVFVGLNLFTPNSLGQDEITIQTRNPDDETPIDVKIAFTNILKFCNCPTVYNVLLKRIKNALSMVKIGRDHFYPEKKIVLENRRLEIWPGCVASIDNYKYNGGLLLQCDVTHKVVRKDSVYDVMQEVGKTTISMMYYQEQCESKLLGQIVLTSYDNQSYRIHDFEWKKNCLSEFECNDGSMISYGDYFRNEYGLNIGNLKQPLIKCKNKSKIRENPGQYCYNFVYLVPELCMLTGLTDDMIKDFRLRRELHEHCRVTPKQSHDALLQFVKDIYSCENATNLLNSWGIKIERKAVEINAKQMEPENIYFGSPTADSEPVSVSAGEDAEFKQALAHNKVIVGIEIKKWLIITPIELSNKAQALSQALQARGLEVGVSFPEPTIIQIQSDLTEDYIAAINSNMKLSSYNLVVTILNERNEQKYNAIKKECYVRRGFQCQVVLGNTITEEPQFNNVAVNIVLQINAKMGGQLWRVEIPIQHFMVIGIEVWHDSAYRGRSFVTVVGSANDTCTNWISRFAYQHNNERIVDVLQSCMIRVLRSYKFRNGLLPSTTFIYVNKEVRLDIADNKGGVALKFLEAFASLTPGYKPTVAVCTVWRGSNTRFYVSDPNVNGQILNPKPGTVVDNTVTKNLADFFLVSQSVRQGTVTPTYYSMRYNSNELSPHIIKLMTFKCCNMHYNTPGISPFPAPLMYAHKLAYMVGQNLKAEPKLWLADWLFYL